jgi:non-homologous end joining protein Ku
MPGTCNEAFPHGTRSGSQPGDHLKAPFKPQEFSNSYRPKVEQFIEQKQKGPEGHGIKRAYNAPVIDLMEALKRSLKSVPPTQTVSHEAKPATGKKMVPRAA